MISKNRDDDGVDQSGGTHLPASKIVQVQSQTESDAVIMSRPPSVVNATTGDGLEPGERSNDNCNSVHSLLGRSFNGDLIASQVYLCITCGVELEDADTLRRHELHCCAIDPSANLPGSLTGLEETEGYRKLVCEICRAYFSETDHLQEHKLLHLNTSNVCYLCDTFFTNRYLLARHVVCQHSERFGVKQNEEGVHEPYTCAICILRFSTLIALQAHEDSHGITEKTPTCRICSVSNSSHQALQSHLKSNLHAEMKLQLQNLFTCIDCSTVFHCRDAYAMHMMMRAKDESCKKINKLKAMQREGEVQGTPSIVIVKEEPPDTPKTDCSNASPPITRQPRVSLGNSFKGRHPKSESPTPGNTQVCPGCGMLCYDSNHLLSHLRMCGSVLNPQTNNGWGQSQNGLVFKWAVNKTYSLHLPTTMNRKEKQCSHCNKSFLDQDDLAMHVMSDHAREMTDTDRTTSPTVNSRGWQVPERNGESPLVVYSPTNVSVIGPSDQRLSPGTQTLSNQQIVAPVNGSSSQPAGATKETGNGVDTFTPQANSNFDRTSSTEELDKSGEDKPENRKRRRGRSLSSPFSSSHGSQDGLLSEDSNYNSDKSLHEPLSKMPYLAPSACVSLGNNPATIPLDLSQSFREIQPTGHMIKSESDSDTKNHQTLVNEEISKVTTDSSIDQEFGSKADMNSKTTPSTDELLEMGDNCAIDEDRDPPLLQFLLDNRKSLFQCPHCKIVYTDRTLYCLHMGLHNVNNPWQCNMCGKAFDTVHQFSSHVLHFSSSFS